MTLADDDGFCRVSEFPHQPCEPCVVLPLLQLGELRLTGPVNLFPVMSVIGGRAGDRAQLTLKFMGVWACVCVHVHVCVQTQVPCGRQAGPGSASLSCAVWSLSSGTDPTSPAALARALWSPPLTGKWAVLNVDALSEEWSVPSASPGTLRWPQSWPGPTCRTATGERSVLP